MLADLQRDFSRALLSTDGSAVQACIHGDAVAAADRIAIHRNTMQGVVVNAMRLTYPVVERLVGAEFFEGATRLFLSDHTPRTACLDDFGAGFAEFLAAFAPAAALVYLPDVARLEWAIAGALNAEDAPVLDPAGLAGVAPDDLQTLRLTAHPSLRQVRLTTPADAIWKALAGGDEAALARIRIETAPLTVLVHRTDAGVVLRRLSAPERAATEAICTGRPLAEALAVLPEADAMAMLADHLASGRFSRAMVAPGIPG